MWTLSVNFQNDALNAESRDAIADAFQWRGAGDPRGATKAQFRDAIIKEFVKDKVRAYRIKQDIALQPTRVAEPDVT
jgi:hypothetical protein